MRNPKNADKKVYQHQENYPLSNLEEINKARESVGMKPLKIKERFCLKCGAQFTSFNYGVRMCDNCRYFSDNSLVNYAYHEP